MSLLSCSLQARSLFFFPNYFAEARILLYESVGKSRKRRNESDVDIYLTMVEAVAEDPIHVKKNKDEQRNIRHASVYYTTTLFIYKEASCFLIISRYSHNLNKFRWSMVMVMTPTEGT